MFKTVLEGFIVGAELICVSMVFIGFAQRLKREKEDGKIHTESLAEFMNKEGL